MPIDGVWKEERFVAALTRAEVSRPDAFGHGAPQVYFRAGHALKMGVWRRQLIKKQPVLRGFGRRLACVSHHGFVSQPRAEADAPGIFRVGTGHTNLNGSDRQRLNR